MVRLSQGWRRTVIVAVSLSAITPVTWASTYGGQTASPAWTLRAFAHRSGVTTAQSARPAFCSKSNNPYTEQVSMLRSCGYGILALQRVTALPGGGKAYDYGSYTQTVPPAHFNVLKASDKQLSEYGLPTRAQLGSAWYRLMRHIRNFAGPTPYLVQAPGGHFSAPHQYRPLTQGTWSGYVVTPPNGALFNGVSATWYEPDFIKDTTCTSKVTSEFGQWVGLGGVQGTEAGNIAQDGTSFNVPGLGAHQGFIETIQNYNMNDKPVAANIWATPDQPFEASAWWDPANSWYSYIMVNEAPGGKSYIAHSRVVTNFGNSAEAIAETPNSVLSDFQYYEIKDATAYWGSSSALFGSLNYSPQDMYDSNHIFMATPSSLSEGHFIQHYVSCS